MNSPEDTRMNTLSDSSTEQPSSEQGWSTFDAYPGSDEDQPVRLVLASRWQRFGGSIVDNLVVFTLYAALGVSTFSIDAPLWYDFVELIA